jgi:hypothetical protein
MARERRRRELKRHLSIRRKSMKDVVGIGLGKERDEAKK